MEDASVPWCNGAAEELLSHSLSDIGTGVRVIDLQFKDSCSCDLDGYVEGELVALKSPCFSKNGLFYNMVGTVTLLDDNRKALSIQAHPIQSGQMDASHPFTFSSVFDPLTQFKSLSAAIFTLDGRFITASEHFSEIFGSIRNIRDLFAMSGSANSFIQGATQYSGFSQEIRLSTRRGVRWHKAETSLDKSSNYIYLLTHDIQQERNHEGALYRLTNYDKLTNLPNKNLLNEQLENTLATAHKYQRDFGVLYLNLDSFKVINDNFGYQVGDELIQRVADRMKVTLPSNACLYHMGSDEFVVVLDNLNSTEELTLIAEKVMSNADDTYSVANMEMIITSTIGIASYPQHAKDVDGLLKSANAAMYHAKSIGHNMKVVYEEHMAENINVHLTLGRCLRKAIDQEEFVLHYQPKIRLPEETVVGAEALIRWIHPDFGMVSPDQFIPLAEESGLILPLGRWVIRKACLQLKEWREAGYPPIKVSVNLSSRQFMQADLVDMVRDILEETDVDPQYLELELTESMLMADAQKSIEKLHGFRELGLTLSIDDFGTGYSSLAYLKKFPIQALKIDRSFINDLGLDSDNDAIVKATIAMAKSLHLDIIAEGVENSFQADILNSYDCLDVQGYHFSKPLSSDDFVSYLKQNAFIERDAFIKSDGFNHTDIFNDQNIGMMLTLD
ncbi:EAL domain-containing protein [Marinomonas sp. C2222]|uniref:EAL domain-containing protein n=1 Tax=Marinomonas sargassi TaxID=2984494 RepID=A0ABT2YQJ6_9GAMM|nr:EAL domain-containing protein [Marinomonas sargassi]MCV2402162.1 EAL domain-containing protein [Marinomonas sargassi]